MKALIKIASAGKFTQDQEAIMKRVAMVLIEHGFSVNTSYKVKKVKTIKLKVL